jgi:hypothetical protein
MLRNGVNMSSVPKKLIIAYIVFSGFILLLISMTAHAQNVPSGTITINEKEFGFIIGGSEGHGTLNYQGGI